MRVEDSKRASEFPVIDDPREIERAIQSGEGIRFGSLEACPISSFDNSESFIFVWGIVYYDDGFGGRRFTRFCHRYPGACVRQRRIDPLPHSDPRSMMARRIGSKYEDLVIEPADARHHQQIGRAHV